MPISLNVALIALRAQLDEQSLVPELGAIELTTSVQSIFDALQDQSLEDLVDGLEKKLDVEIDYDVARIAFELTYNRSIEIFLRTLLPLAGAHT